MARKTIAKSQTEATKRTRKPLPKPTALVLVLPGADAIDDGLVERAVETLNQVYRAKGLETARAVAECVVALFFDNEAENFHARGNSHLSFAALKKRADLQVSYQFVWNSCAVYDQLRRLPPEIANALPLSHHKLLLPIKDDEVKRKLATAAIEGKLSKRTFEERVKKARKAQQSGSKAGRPTLPAFVKVFGKFGQLVALAEREDVTEESFVHYSKVDARKLLTKLDTHLDSLARIANRVRTLTAE